jgi:hypothetical protein
MVLKSLVRYLTSFVGALVHTVAGLAAVLAVPVLALLVVFLAPSAVGNAGVNSLFDGTVTDVVTDLTAQTPLSTVVLGGGLLVLLVLFVVGQKGGYVLYDIGRPTRTGSPNAAGTEQQTTETTAPTRTTAEVNLTRFRNVSAFMAGLLAVIFVALLAVDIPTQVAGGLGGAALLVIPAVQVVVYTVAAYSAHREWVEGVVLGTLLYFVALVSGVLLLNPLLILFGGLGLKYGLRGVWHAEFALLSMDMGRLGDQLTEAVAPIRDALPFGGDDSADDQSADDTPDVETSRESEEPASEAT